MIRLIFRDTKSQKILLYAREKGYYVDAFGTLFNPKGLQIRCSMLKCSETLHYYRFSINFEGEVRSVYVHQLQALQKFGMVIFDKGQVVRHKNGNSLDNSRENILVGTQSDNMYDRPLKERLEHAIKATQHMRVWSDEQLKEIFDDRYLNNLTYKSLTEKYGIAKSTLSFIFNKSIFAQNYKISGPIS